MPSRAAAPHQPFGSSGSASGRGCGGAPGEPEPRCSPPLLRRGSESSGDGECKWDPWLPLALLFLHQPDLFGTAANRQSASGCTLELLADLVQCLSISHVGNREVRDYSCKCAL